MNAENQDQEERDSPNSKDRRIIGAPVKPTPMVRVRTSVDSTPSAVIKSSVSLDGELLAISRRKILKDFVSGAESRKRTIELLGVKKSRFYELLRDFRRSSDYRGLIRQKRGPSVGSTHRGRRLQVNHHS